MLSQHERRTLALIEQQLKGEDPDLDRWLTTFECQEPAVRRVRHRVAWCVVLLGAWFLGSAFALRNADVLLLAMVMLLAGAGCWLVIAARAMHRRHAPGGRTGR